MLPRFDVISGRTAMPNIYPDKRGRGAWHDYMPRLSGEMLDVLHSAGQYLCPPLPLIYRAFDLVTPQDVKVVILGQDPYHTPGKASGLAFGYHSTWTEAPNSSLQNIASEVKASTGQTLEDLSLESWARQGVLLLNTRLTTLAGKPLAHRGLGWEQLTADIISKLSRENSGIVFMLWGAEAIGWRKHIAVGNKHLVLTASHPCSYSAHRSFLGCGHFSRAGEHLEALGKTPIIWGPSPEGVHNV